jgi:hypothetical protein
MGKSRPVADMAAEHRVVVDNIVQDYVSRESDVFIYVTGPLTSNDVYTINSDFRRFYRHGERSAVLRLIFLAQMGESKTMLLVHNFMNYWTDDAVEKHIQVCL